MNEPTPFNRQAAFPATRWSVVVLAGAATPQANDALASLCRDYWRPLFLFARRRGHGPEDAQDLTQGFILGLLESGSFADADPNRGRFRTFLLSAFSHYLANDRRAQRAQKRGGAMTFVDMTDPQVEASYAASHQRALGPEREFDRSWALAVLESVMVRLRDEYAAAGRSALFDAIQPLLSGAAGRPGYAQIGAMLGLSESAVTVAVHRMRKRYGQCLREAIASTVSTEAEVDGELRHLITILSEAP